MQLTKQEIKEIKENLKRYKSHLKLLKESIKYLIKHKSDDLETLNSYKEDAEYYQLLIDKQLEVLNKNKGL